MRSTWKEKCREELHISGRNSFNEKATHVQHVYSDVCGPAHAYRIDWGKEILLLVHR